MRILLISSGIGPWPNAGWGACENLVADFAWALEQLGQSVRVFHKKPTAQELRQEIESYKPDVVHCEYDDHVLHLVPVLKEFPGIRVLLTTHYAFLSQPYKLVQDGYMDRFVFTSELASSSSLELAVLSQTILETYTQFGNVPREKIWIFPNGTRTDQIRFSDETPLKRALCLGKVETRKNQLLLSQCGLIDFIGPLKEDESFTKEFGTLSCYKGTWTREQMYASLTNYSCLVLMSRAEAHPLVIGEALAAGCSIICNETSSANLPRNVPWIHILPDTALKTMGNFNELVQKVIGENTLYRTDIRRWAEQNLDWKLRAEQYIRHFQPNWTPPNKIKGPLRVALIGPGIMSIPPTGWGAVEQLIWDYSQALKQKGIHVDIINTPKREEIIQKVNDGGYDTVHLHYDVFWDILDKLRAKSVCVTSHYPYIDNEDKWSRDGFDGVFKGICEKAKTSSNVSVFCLCQKDKEVFQTKGGLNDVFLLPNGVDVGSFQYKDLPEKANRSLVLAKIEPRKRQHLTYWLPQVDYAGRGSFAHPNFKGEMTRAELHRNLTDYGNLVLLSEGESAPLVVKEAMAAGLGVVLSESAGNEFKESIPWVTIIPEQDLLSSQKIEMAIEMNRMRSLTMRELIREWTREKWDWPVLVNQYISNLKGILEKCS